MQTLLQSQESINVALLQTDVEKEILFELFEEIVQEQSWQPNGQIRAYPLSSVHFGLQSKGQWIGGLQLVVGNQCEGLPCLTVWPELTLWNQGDNADIALLALRREYRGRQKLFWLLCIEMWRYCRNQGIKTLWIEVTPANLQLYRRLGWPLQIGGPLRSHWGELCYPCWMTVEQINNEIACRAVRSEHYQAIHRQMHRPELPLA